MRQSSCTDIEITSCNTYSDYTYLVQGQGNLKRTTKKLDWKYYIDSDEKEQSLTIEPLGNEKGEPIYCSEKLTFHEESWSVEGAEADDFNAKGLTLYRELSRCIVDNQKFLITEEQVLKQIQVIEEAHKQNEKTLNKFIMV